MPLDIDDVMAVLSQLAEEENMRVTVKESLKGGLIAGTATVLGGLVAGPIGLAVGGAAGGLTAAIMSNGKFESVASIIMKMEPSKQQLLYDNAQKIISNLDITDLMALQAMLTGNMILRKDLIACISNYMNDQLHLQLID